MSVEFAHDKARYEGDGDPGCYANCRACYVHGLQQELQKALKKIELANQAWDECQDNHVETCMCGIYKMHMELNL